MAGKKLEYQIAVDSGQAVTGVKNFSRAVQDELAKVEADFDDTASAGDRVATVLSAMAKDLDVELGRAAEAADALRQALGEDLAGKADVGQLIADLQRMGLTFEDIVADADKLAAAMKELDTVQTKGLDAGLGNVNTKVGQIGKSADSSKSVLANMIGNTTQDLGALGGVAGSTGVAIGQMGEYMADALGSGEKFSSVLKSFGTVAVPLAGVSFAMKGISDHFADIAATKAFNTDQIDAFADSLKDGADGADAIAKSLEKVGKVEISLDGHTHDITARLGELGLTVDQFAFLVAGGKERINAWGEAMRDAGRGGDALTEVLGTAVQQSENYGRAIEQNALFTKVFGDSQKEAAEATEQAAAASKVQSEHMQFQAQMASERSAQVQSETRQYLAASQARREAEVENAEATLEWATAVATALKGALAYNDALASMEFKTADINGAVTAMAKFNKQSFDLANIAQDVHESFAALGETLKKDTEDGQKRIALTGDVATEAGRKQQDAIEGVARALELEFAAAYDKAGGSLHKFRDSAAEIGDATLGQLRDELGLTDDEVALLRDQLNLTEGDYTARFELSGTEEAITKIGLLQTSIDDLPDEKQVKVEQEIIAGDYVGALKIIQDYYDQNPATLPVVPTISRGPTSNPIFGAPTTSGLSAGGLAAAPAATAGPTLPAVTMAVAAPKQTQPVINLYTTLNAGVIGDPFARAVEDGTRRNLRLMPVSP
jgi:hypothetical protein